MPDRKPKQKIYRPAIVGPKRQMTIPEEMMRELRLEPGDFIEFEVTDYKIVSARPVKPIPIDSLPTEFLDGIRAGTQDFHEGRYRTITQHELDNERTRRARSAEAVAPPKDES